MIANKEPYEDGWLIKVRLSDPEAARAMLMSGVEAFEYFRKKIDDNEIRCFRCVD